MAEGNGNVSYSVKELLSQLHGKLDAVLLMVSGKADKGEFEDLRRDVVALQLAEAGRVTLASWQRWFIGSFCVGVVGAVATLVWLAVGG